LIEIPESAVEESSGVTDVAEKNKYTMANLRGTILAHGGQEVANEVYTLLLGWSMWCSLDYDCQIPGLV